MDSKLYNQLHEQMLADLARLRAKKPQPPVRTRAQLAGRYLTRELRRSNKTPEQLADDLDLPLPMVQVLLSGDVPGWVLSEVLIAQLAAALDCTPEVLRQIYCRDGGDTQPA